VLSEAREILEDEIEDERNLFLFLILSFVPNISVVIREDPITLSVSI